MSRSTRDFLSILIGGAAVGAGLLLVWSPWGLVIAGGLIMFFGTLA